MRRIDLICKLVGPLIIALIDGISTTLAIWITLGMNATSVLVEYFAIAKVKFQARRAGRISNRRLQIYDTMPSLHTKTAASASHESNTSLSTVTPSTQRSFGRIFAQAKTLLGVMSDYLHHPVFLPSIALSLLYLTVLSFSGQMITYLHSLGFTSASIGIFRTISVAFELSATWLAPIAMNKVGPLRAGLWFVSWQTIWVVVSVCFFWTLMMPSIAALALVVGVIISRIGLWGFDLCVQLIIQEV